MASSVRPPAGTLSSSAAPEAAPPNPPEVLRAGSESKAGFVAVGGPETEGPTLLGARVGARGTHYGIVLATQELGNVIPLGAVTEGKAPDIELNSATRSLTIKGVASVGPSGMTLGANAEAKLTSAGELQLGSAARLGGDGRLDLGGAGSLGTMRLFDKQGRSAAEFRPGLVTLGGTDCPANLWITNKDGNPTVRISGQSGDIEVFGDVKLAGADCAEDFPLDALAVPEPGTVLVIAEGGRLRVGTEAYDRRVAGVVSGAGGFRPGLRLNAAHGDEAHAAIALSGRTGCKVDAIHGPIQVGDLLVTSPTPGHAMRASDPGRAFGAVIGKALASLEAGQGVIPILVALH